MTHSEFIKRRKSSKYNIGDKVYFEHILGWNANGLPISKIDIGIVESLPDSCSVFYGVSLMNTDSFCLIDVLPRDMRKMKKGEY